MIVFGDTNTRYTRTVDIPGIFKSDNGMADAWIQLVRNGVPPTSGTDALLCDNPSPNTTCEIVDKTWYRGSPAVTLSATKFQYAGNMFLQDDGNILSDHDPVLVDFAWTTSAKVKVSDTFGGENGDWFNDLDTVSALSAPKVSSVTLRGADRVDTISLSLSTGQTFTHGGTGGTATTLTLNTGETLAGATLCRGDKDGKSRIFYAELTTSTSRSVKTGVKTSDCVTRSAASGWAITGFLGRAKDEVDQLGFVYGKV